MGRQLVVDCYAMEPHFVDHLAPVWRAMPPEMRGAFYTKSIMDPGLRGEPRSPRAGMGDLLLVCSFGDLKVAAAVNSRPVVFMEHGVGFTFQNDYGYTYGSYSGSRERPLVLLHLAVNQYVVDAYARAGSRVPAVVIGSPKMDRWYPAPPPPHARPNYCGKPTVALTFHWDGKLLAPGIGNAFDHMRSALPELAARDEFRLIGHSHPRFRVPMRMACAQLDIPFVAQLDDVFDQSDMLIGDATSAMYEFASLDRPVLTMNTPNYRNEPDDGLRFWQHIPGNQVDEPADLVSSTLTALADPPELQAIRRSAVEAAYPFRGDAATRAVAAIQNFVEEHRFPTDGGDPTQETYRSRLRESMRRGGRRFTLVDDDIIDMTKE